MSLTQDGSFTYTPNAGFVGTDSFTYIITDGVLTGQATVTINVTNTAPSAQPDSYSVQEGRMLTIAAPGLLANDSDADGDAVSGVPVLPAGQRHGEPDAGRQLHLHAERGLRRHRHLRLHRHRRHRHGAGDGDHHGDRRLADRGRRQSTPPPTGQALTIAAPGLLANDTDPNGDAITAFQFFQPANGTVSLTQDGSFTYTPNAGFIGTDSFNYAITDGVLTGQGTVTINVVSQRRARCARTTATARGQARR